MFKIFFKWIKFITATAMIAVWHELSSFVTVITTNPKSFSKTLIGHGIIWWFSALIYYSYGIYATALFNK